MSSQATTAEKAHIQTPAIKTGVSFSRIFTAKKSLVVYFPSEIDLNFQLLKLIVSWVDFIESIILVLPSYQVELYRKLIKRPQISIETLEEHKSGSQSDLLLVLTTDRRVHKVFVSNAPGAVWGFGKKVNVRLQPVPADPIELCRKMAELLKIDVPADEIRLETLIEKDYLNDIINDEQKKQGKKESKYRFVFDLNTLYNKVRISGQIKRLGPPSEYLLLKTTRPLKRSKLISIRYDMKTPEELSKRFNLYEVVKYCSGAKTIITDNRAFYDFLQNLSLRDRVLYCGKGVSMNRIIDFIQKV